MSPAQATTAGATAETRPLLGKRTLITGGARGIGAELSRAFAEAGASLVLTGRDGEALSRLAAELSSAHAVPVETVVADLSISTEPERLAEAALGAYGGLDVLVNNAGISYPELVVDLSADHLDKVLNVNLRAPVLLAARVGKAMAVAGSGSVIAVASAAGSRPLAEHYGYCIAKAGLVMAMNVLALELGPAGVRANSISPTVTLTDMGQRVWLDQPAKAAPMLARIPLGRFALPREVSAAALWLASDASAMVTGTNLAVDGGYLIS